MNPQQAGLYRNTIIRSMIVLATAFMLWRGICGGLFPQMGQPVLFRSGYDLSYWMIRLSGLDRLLITHPVLNWSLIVLFFASGIILYVYPCRRFWAFVFAAAYLLHTLLFNLYLCQTSHVHAGFAILLWACCAGSDSSFALWWRTMRYYVCYIFFTAFLWKLYYGSLLQWNGGLLFFREYAAPYLFRYPHTALAGLYRFLLQHPFILNLGEKLLLLSQGFLVAGFFTTKYDRLFILFLLLFIVTLLFFGHHFFVEFLVLVLPLMRPGDWKYFQVRRMAGSIQAGNK